MTATEINKAISNMKIHFTKSEKIEYWINLVLILIFIGLISYVKIVDDFKNQNLSFFTIFIFGLIILLIRHKVLGRKLTGYKSKLSSDDFKKANKATSDLNNWIILSNSDNYFSAIGESGWHLDGIKITALHKEGKLYLNSIETPSIRSSPITFGKKKRMKLKLIGQYQSIIKGINVSEEANKEIKRREEEFWNESEWTLSNSIKRIVLYSLSIPFIILAIWIMSKGISKHFFVGLGLISICGTYIYFDLKVIIEKRKRKKQGHNNI